MGRGTWESHTAISDLLHTYHWHFNTGRFDLLAALFARSTYQTHYPWSETGHGVALGADAVLAGFRAMVRLHDGLPRVQYSVTNAIIDVDEDAGTATSRAQFTGLFGEPETWSPHHVGIERRDHAQPMIHIFTVGRYEDTFARDNDGWYFTSRVVHADFTGDRSGHMAMDPVVYGAADH